jgi:hypothetical protein
VDAVGPARLHVAGQLELVEQLAHEMRDLDRKGESAGLVRRIEIEDDVVRPRRVVDPRVPRVHVDAVHLHHPQERLAGVHEREVHLPRITLTRMRREAPRRDPRRHALRRLLLEEAFARDPIAESSS